MSNFRIYNTTLCPDVWDEYLHLEPRVRVNLLRLAYDFYKKTKFTAPIADIYLMGSIANYNWTPDSDLDVHIMVDYNALKMPPETANKMVKTVGSQWNMEHNVVMKGHKVEMNLQSVTEMKPHVTGIYSLVKDSWIRKPYLQPPQLDTQTIKVQYDAMKKYIESAMNSGNTETMKSAKEYLDAYRQYGLDHGGELSQQNIVFKILRAKGILKALKDMITVSYDKEMSVAETTEKDIKSTIPINPIQFQRGHDQKLQLKNFTLDNLKALRDKAKRFYNYYQQQPEKSVELKKSMDDYQTYDAEIKRRIAYINKPVAEVVNNLSMPSISTSNATSQRPSPIDVSSELSGLPSVLVRAIKDIERALDNKSKKGMMKFDMEYVYDLIDDIMGIYNITNVSEKVKQQIKDFIILYLKKDYHINEGVGAGIPETDRLKIDNQDGSVRRWQIRSKDAPKTPTIPSEVNEELLTESPKLDTLKKHRKQLTPEERTMVMNAGAVWHHGPSGEESPGIWKSIIKGKTWYCCNTHRAYQVKPTLKGAIKAFEFIKTTS